MANWFIAAVPSPLDWFDGVGELPEGFRRFAADDLHVTAAFLGACSEERARAAWDAVRDLWTDGPIAATLGAVVPLGNPRRYSALSATFADGREQAARLISTVLRPACEAAGSRLDTRPVTPHITLARPPQRGDDGARAAGLEWARGVQLGNPAVSLDALGLFTWADDRQQQLFRIVDRRAF